MAAGRKTGGRQKGVPNKSTAEVKSAIEAAYNHMGGDKNFGEWASKNQDVFYTQLFPRLLPIQVKHGGDDDSAPIRFERVIIDPSNPNR